MTFKNLNELFSKLEQDIQDTLSEEVADCVKDEMEYEIQMNVYNAYSPFYYKRREASGGLIDQSNMESKVEENTLAVKEALIKSGAQIAQSDFSADCIEILQAYWRMSRNFCVI